MADEAVELRLKDYDQRVQEIKEKLEEREQKTTQQLGSIMR